ncbi:MAG: IS200/IS605 family transposase [Bacteroidales bacterium]
MSYIKIMIHCVWTTKNRFPFLSDDIRDKVIFHIRDNALKKGIFIDHINGYTDHLHALISMSGKQCVSDIMQLIKGESSYWINRNKLTKLRFEWQDDFYSVSVGSNHLERLRKYIRNQPDHHRKVHMEVELKDLVKKYQLKKGLD